MTLQVEVHVVRGAFSLDVAFRAEAGEVVVILGPNGAGKSTLLRVLAGLIPLGSGRVALDGRAVEDPGAGIRQTPQDRKVGVVFQDYRLFPHLSAKENVAFGPRSTGTSKGAALAQAGEWLARFGLSGLEAHRPHQLSGGQAQRVALARALINRPGLLLLDEPLAALDASSRADVRADLRHQLDEFEGVTLMVTHDPLDAMTLAHRLLIIEGGEVVQDASPEHVAQHPATPYVARLVGLSLFRGEAKAGVIQLVDGGHLVTADTELTGPALAVVRPSSVIIQSAPPVASSARNVWPRRIEFLESLGDRVRVTLAGDPPLHADITTTAVADMRLAAGDDVWVSIKATDITTYADHAQSRPA